MSLYVQSVTWPDDSEFRKFIKLSEVLNNSQLISVFKINIRRSTGMYACLKNSVVQTNEFLIVENCRS